MNNLPKVKRDQLILIAVCTVATVGALFFFVADAQRSDLKKTQDKTEYVRKKLVAADALARTEGDIKNALQENTKQLGDREAQLAPERDTYAWMLQTMSPFLADHRGAGISGSGISQPEITDAAMIPKFSYKTATFHVKSSGFFHDFGRFVSDLESTYPYVRVQNIDLAPAPVASPADAEKLTLNFEIVMLMQPSTSIESR
jgi:Tfp pilus assembly protein PilO